MSVRHHIGKSLSGKAVRRPVRAGRPDHKIFGFQAFTALGALAGVALVVAACTRGGAQYAGELYSVDNFYGGIVADEPRAALVGREILNAGGNAADAAVAAYFVMSATMPSTAGLGGGGICVIHRGEEDKIASEVLDFLPRAAAGGLVAVPASARGMAALAARYGTLPWAQLVAPAESIAQTGEATSRALAHDVALGEKKLRADPQMAALFTRADGSMLNEGDNLRQPELAGVLGQIRAKGPNELYGGVLGQQLAASAQAIGAPLTIEDLRGFQAKFYKPLEIKWGDQSVFLPQPPASGGVAVAQMLKALDSAGDKNRAAFLADASMRLTADRAQWMDGLGESKQPADALVSDQHVAQVMQGHQSGRATPAASLPFPAQRVLENPFAASVVAVDKDGLGIACNFTMNALFGAGRVAQGTGIILSPAPSEKGFGFSSLAPLIVANDNNGELYYLSAGSGGMAGVVAEADMLYAVTEERIPLETATLRPRVYHGVDPDVAYFDVSGDENPSGALSAAGYQTEQREALGRVNAIFCPRGTPTDPDSCQLRNDFRGNGLATLVSGK
ncbi:MAG TPA: gamma-glutamyltransferase [Dongiaceae bacterium]|jgi:gamma-glutamyltranspeptidase/glutathione hydrolase|nr:gamma-glutamyltransferase [Dongiaceae bacterium]